MTAEARQLRNTKYLLWTLMLLNMLGLYLLRHPPRVKAGGGAATSYAAAPAQLRPAA
jgi:hypothetical protein